MITLYNKPFRFYLLSTIIPWFFWFLWAYISHHHLGFNTLGSILGILGLVAPVFVAFAMSANHSELRKDFISRLFWVKQTSVRYLLIAIFLMLVSIVVAQFISLLFGHDISQFKFAPAFSFSAGIFPAWFLLIIAPLLEELAWHSYGTDCLRVRFNLFTTSIIFAFFWVIWHIPLSFIKDYYHSNVAESGIIYSLNFAISLFPFVILMNWLYYKTGRNIFIAIVFHISAGMFNEIFQTHPDSKVIQTCLLLILTIYLLIKDRDFFFKREV